MGVMPWRCCQEDVGCWRHCQPLPAACQCRDWANWENPWEGSWEWGAWGAHGCDAQREGLGSGPSSLAALHPLLPMAGGSGAQSRTWGEDKQPCRKITFQQFNKTPPTKCLPSGLHQGELSRSNNKESRPQPAQSYLCAGQGEACSWESRLSTELPQSGDQQSLASEAGAVGAGSTLKKGCLEKPFAGSRSMGCSPAGSPSAQSRPSGAGEWAPIPSQDWWY